ncbi:MAG: c-type cytochrome [Candidatus Solibacter usitatus]|nr:c-type cytochrome [Candidatus Solibacter usitatus]
MLQKLLLGILLAVVVVVGGGLGYLYLRRPATAPAADIQVSMTPERIARGTYLFERVMDCDGCHSQRDLARFAGPVVASGRGQGFVFPAEMGLPGTMVASNITPDKETGIGNWSDGEKIRAIREGLGRDGRVLFPMMPYTYYRTMSDEDAQAIVAYMNTLAPVRNALPRTQIAFPVNLMITGVPQPAGSVPPPDKRDKVKYGEYLAAMAGCVECHTPMKRGQPLPGKRLAGGREFRFPMGVAVSANITPDAETGIGRWSEQQFLDKVYQYKEYSEKGPPVVGPESFTLMPWLNLAQWSPEELGAVFAYLKSQPPVSNAVETHPGYPKKKS